jgi:hypothetical protein
MPVSLTTPPIPRLASSSTIYANEAGFPIHGIEGQLNYRPGSGTRILFNHASIRIDSPNNTIATAAPRESDGLTLFQKLPGDVDLSVMHQQASSAPWVSSDSASQRGPTWRRLDIRVGKAFQLGATKGDIALVVQNIGPGYYDYPTSWALRGGSPIVVVNSPQQFEHRAFVTLSLQM